MSSDKTGPDFTGKTVIITGGAGGLGKAFSLEFARLGAQVISNDIDPAAGDSLTHEAEGLSGRIHFVAGSMGEAETCDRLAAKAAELGGTDILCNNVGIQPAASYVPAHELDDALWDAILTVNLKSFFWMVKRCVPQMKARGKGAIINTASVQGLQSQRGAAAYAASKGGILSLTRQLALEYAEDNIRVLAIAPGTFDTPLLRDVAAGIDDKTYMERLRKAYPMKRFGNPEELARVVSFLASDGASFMTGECVTVDGGIMAQGGWAQ
ncbi:SDR family NAD(P)-dependent oxidoreductase [Asticcacaulis sp. 201]|uniref:SDR family NAD(P)-dependent oxidoreductase n=1 Tax=Asticcacaulis sp. 201 TaxID=3028787 RepID=UPI002916D90D|nr:SDR family NAD(P)-dependent oxidoreductase [Asticcacaulis sp. 201]MDV6330693.1 SDR family NAD(P)-dependent oxidoreductase [Asticcacaulis sp. 201]